MKVIDIINLLRVKDQEISIREDNWFVFKTTAERIPEEYKSRKVIDIIPNYELPDIEKDCFVINLESQEQIDMKRYDFERQVNQDLFYHILGDVIDDLHDASFENETFIIRAYNWGDEEDEAPNFEHKPSGFKMWWYKYPLRSPEVNISISHEQFSCILYDCKNSITASEDKHPKIYVEIDKWWE